MFFPSCRHSESLCQNTKWCERRQLPNGEMWNEPWRGSWPRPEKLRAYLKMTSLPSHVSDPYQDDLLYVLTCGSLNIFPLAVVSDRSTTKHHPISECPPALRAGTAESGGDGLLWAGWPDWQREHGRKYHRCKSSQLESSFWCCYLLLKGLSVVLQLQ